MLYEVITRPGSGLAPPDGHQFDTQDRPVIDGMAGAGLVTGIDVARTTLHAAGEQEQPA